jgi:hypothetical protein
MRLLVSIHDVTPFHHMRLARVETLLARHRVGAVAYLVVPRYHGGWPIERDLLFQAWTAHARPWRPTWILHGFTHSEPTTPDGVCSRAQLSLGDRIRRIVLTGGEAECLTLNDLALESGIRRAQRSFIHTFGQRPAGFVAPAWLCDNRLAPLLRRLGFRYTEDLGGIVTLDDNSRIRCPVITWTTRTLARQRGSVVIAPLLERLWRSSPILRLAIHPFDMDHPVVVASIERVLAAALSIRESASYEDVVPGIEPRLRPNPEPIGP